MKTIIIDLDDTLVHCGVHYDAAKDEFIELQHQRLRLPRNTIRSILDAVDHETRKLPDGWSAHRLPNSFEAVSAALDVIALGYVDNHVGEQVRNIGRSVFDAEYRLIPGSKEMLERLSRYHKLVLYTKGDETIQRKKIEQHGLQRYFTHTFVVPLKTHDVFTHMMYIIDPKWTSRLTDFVIIGDSLQDEMRNARDHNISGVWVSPEYYDNHIYTYYIESLSKLDTIFSIPNGIFSVPSARSLSQPTPAHANPEE